MKPLTQIAKEYNISENTLNKNVKGTGALVSCSEKVGNIWMIDDTSDKFKVWSECRVLKPRKEISTIKTITVFISIDYKQQEKLKNILKSLGENDAENDVRSLARRMFLKLLESY